MRTRIIILVMVIFSTICLAQTEKEDFKKFMEADQSAFKSYHNQQDADFIQYKEEIERKWNEFKESTQKEWVSYSNDFSGRSTVNFETGKIEVEVIVEKENPQADKILKEKLAEHIKSIFSETDETKKAILSKQIKVPDGKKIINASNMDDAITKIIKKSKKTEIKGKDKTNRVAYIISLDMVPNHIQIRADKYKAIIEEECKRFNVDPALVLGIIHTESFFNPKAYNRRGNAYGMMQIVPKYAGLTMNNVLFKQNKQPSSTQLFNAETNIKMGVGYIRWLIDNKWDKVKNKTNLQYCIICSYNGGPGTIYKAMTGKMNKIGTEKWNKMFDDLNTMDSNKLYKKLRKDVPWEETRNYIRLVKERMDKFYKHL